MTKRLERADDCTSLSKQQISVNCTRPQRNFMAWKLHLIKLFKKKRGAARWWSTSHPRQKAFFSPAQVWSYAESEECGVRVRGVVQSVGTRTKKPGVGTRDVADVWKALAGGVETPSLTCSSLQYIFQSCFLLQVPKQKNKGHGLKPDLAFCQMGWKKGQGG